MVNANYFASFSTRWVHQMMEDRASVPRTTADIQHACTWGEQWEEMLGGVGVLQFTNVNGYYRAERDSMLTIWGAEIVAPCPIDLHIDRVGESGKGSDERLTY
jgi:hypothetical protein